MRLAAVLLAGLWLCAAALPPAAAQSQADVDALFGAEPKGAAAGGDGVVGLRLGKTVVAAAIPAAEHDGGLCLPLVPLLDALEVAHEASDGRIAITLYAPERRIVIDPAARTATVNGEAVNLGTALSDSAAGPCLMLAAIGRILPVDAQDDRGNLRVQLDARAPLPIAARLEREEQRKLRLVHEPQRAAFAELDNPWRAFSWPAVDLSLTAGVEPGRPVLGAAIEASGDLLWMTGRLRSVAGADGEASLRLSLERDMGDGPSPLPLAIRRVALGDVAVPAQPLIGAQLSGRGLFVASAPSTRASLFDTVEIRGPLPRGWEAELTQGSRLIAVQTRPDALGDYAFTDVPLVVGDNRFEVRLYGPHGETEVREFVRSIGAELHPENEVEYSFGVIQSGRPLFGPELDDVVPGSFAIAGLGIGITPTLSGAVDVRAPLGGGAPAATVGLHAALLGGYGSVLVGGDGGGQPTVALAAARRFGRLNASLALSDNGDFDPLYAPDEVRNVARRAALALTTVLALPGRPVSVQSEWSHQVERSGIVRDTAELTAGTTIGAWRMTSGFTLERFGAPGAGSLAASGALTAARSAGRFRLRGTIDYGLAGGGPPVRSLALGLGVKAGPATLSAEARYDPGGGGPGLSLSAERSFGPISVSAGATVGQGSWRIGTGVALAFGHDGSGYRLAAPGVSRTGAVRPRLFRDEDGDGLQDPDDAPVPGGRFLVASSIRDNATGADGAAEFGGLRPGARTDLEVQLASLPDLGLRPAAPGLAVRPRPGQLLDIAVPLQPTGEIEARLVLPGPAASPLSGITVTLSDASGRLQRSTVTDFDGYASFDGLPFGAYRVAASGAPEGAVATLSIDGAAPLARTVLAVDTTAAPSGRTLAAGS